MARGDQLGRQWRIIQTLLTSRQGKTASDLAAELECHARTVYRDLEALQLAGFPLFTDRIDGKNHWSLLENVKQQIPLPLSLTELMALYFSRDMLKILKDTVFYDALETLFQKIKATLPPAYIDYLGRIQKSLQVGYKPYKAYGRFKDILDRVNEAVVKRRFVEIVYFTMSRKRETERKVAPYKVWYFDGTFYLIGFCQLRQDVRLFAVDRIRKLELTEETFEMPDEFDGERFMQSSFGVFRGAPTSVKIRFDADVAGYIEEKTWHATQTLDPQADGSVVLSMQVAGIDEVKFWVMSWGSKATVLEPQSLRDAVCSEATGMIRHYG
jgi:predicted DNA-binding transcriptional regulator YafY